MVDQSRASITSRSPSSGKKAQSKKDKPADPRTLFVKFHPPSASITRQHLSDHFSDYGPVNRCSVIRQTKPRRSADDGDDDGADTDNLNRGSRGYGFVRFVHEDDARDAADAVLRKKRTEKRADAGRGEKGEKGMVVGSAEIMVVDGIEYRLHAERAVDAATAAASAPGKKERGGAAAAAAAEEGAPPRAAADGLAAEAAAAKALSNEKADALYKAESKRKRTSRVILRNLSFYANENHIRTAMESEFGPVVAVDLPLVPDLPREDGRTRDDAKRKKSSTPRHRGFAFVTFASAAGARKAVERGNAEVKIKNRVVAIDFSVSRVEHQKMQKEEQKKKNEAEGNAAIESSDGSSDSESDSGDENDSDGSGSDGEGDSSDSGDEEDSDSDSESESESEGESNEKEEESSDKTTKNDSTDGDNAAKEAPEFNQNEANRTLFLRNIPFDSKRHDVFELFREFGHVEAVHLVKDRQTGVFKGTAFVRFGGVDACAAAMEASGGGDDQTEGGSSQFISSKNVAMGLAGDGDGGSGLALSGRRILVDLAVDRTTASSLAVRRDADGKATKKSVGKDRRNLYLKNEGRVSSAADGLDATDAGATHGGTWEDLPPGDRARRERAFADKSTKLRSPLFFINPRRVSVRNLGKHVTEAELKGLAFGALKAGVKEGRAGAKDAVAQWRAMGELPHAEVMKRATDPDLVCPPLDEKNVRESIPSVYIDRDTTGGKKTADAPSRGFGFVEFTHHAHALAVLRQLNNNPAYSEQYAAGGKHAATMKMQKRGGKKSKKMKAVDPETGAEFLGEDGKVCVPRLIVEFTAENKVKARQQAEKIAQKKANKIKQRIEKKEKQREEKPSDEKEKKEKKKGRGQLQREKKRARKEAGDDDAAENKEGNDTKKQKLDDKSNESDKPREKKPKQLKPQKKRKTDKDEDALEDMIRSYKSSFSKGAAGNKASAEEAASSEPKKKSREEVAKKRWFE